MLSFPVWFVFPHALFLLSKFDSVPQYWPKQITRKKEGPCIYVCNIYIHTHARVYVCIYIYM